MTSQQVVVVLTLMSVLSIANAAIEASTPEFVTCKTTASDDHFVIELKPEWSPLGVRINMTLYLSFIYLFNFLFLFQCQVERFVELVKAKFFDDSPLFRVVKVRSIPNFFFFLCIHFSVFNSFCLQGFLVQFGISGLPHVTQEWRKKGPETQNHHQ
jgi:hypothetical protein